MPGDNDLGENPSSDKADRNLLFGVIALQNDFITREQLVAAFDSWVHDKSRDLPEILEKQGGLSTEDREFLDRLVAKFRAKHGGDAKKSLAALSSVSRVRPDLEKLNDLDLGASLLHVGKEVPSDLRQYETVAPVTSNPHLGRFRILRPHAKGGLGQVSVALDQELNREVALKEIQPHHADHQTIRERFVLEAEITGGLEHPGIVPVYGLGHAADGRPFYAMRFVKGDSLEDEIELFHKPDNPNRKASGARQLALRQLLGRFIDVCNAMEYAHSRGVLHRDLKPGNIMVGKYGETLVVDWGLAKAAGKNKITSDEGTLHPASGPSRSGQTQPGSVMGTPQYMSPEQAAGKLEELGPACDVYSLGATLYHVLCGQPPFNGKSVAEILANVQKGNFPKPRSIVAEVPLGLEAICLKAMALKSKDRYQTPRQVADDLEHWLADEPVAACPESVHQKVARNFRKNPSRVALIVVGSVLVVRYGLVNLARFVLPDELGASLHEMSDIAFRAAVVGAIGGSAFSILAGMSRLFRQRRLELVRDRASHFRESNIILSALIGAVIMLLLIKRSWGPITNFCQSAIDKITSFGD
jgi:serine/threonine-protein kinase